MNIIRRIAYIIAFLPVTFAYPAEFTALPAARDKNKKLPLLAIILTAIYWLFLLVGITLIVAAYVTR
jgi:hypothetical protein